MQPIETFSASKARNNEYVKTGSLLILSPIDRAKTVSGWLLAEHRNGAAAGETGYAPLRKIAAIDRRAGYERPRTVMP